VLLLPFCTLGNAKKDSGVKNLLIIYDEIRKLEDACGFICIPENVSYDEEIFKQRKLRVIPEACPIGYQHNGYLAPNFVDLFGVYCGKYQVDLVITARTGIASVLYSVMKDKMGVGPLIAFEDLFGKFKVYDKRVLAGALLQFDVIIEGNKDMLNEVREYLSDLIAGSELRDWGKRAVYNMLVGDDYFQKMDEVYRERDRYRAVKIGKRWYIGDIEKLNKELGRDYGIRLEKFEKSKVLIEEDGELRSYDFLVNVPGRLSRAKRWRLAMEQLLPLLSEDGLKVFFLTPSAVGLASRLWLSKQYEVLSLLGDDYLRFLAMQDVACTYSPQEGRPLGYLEAVYMGGIPVLTNARWSRRYLGDDWYFLLSTPKIREGVLAVKNLSEEERERYREEARERVRKGIEEGRVGEQLMMKLSEHIEMQAIKWSYGYEIGLVNLFRELGDRFSLDDAFEVLWGNRYKDAKLERLMEFSRYGYTKWMLYQFLKDEFRDEGGWVPIFSIGGEEE
jgi:glycosyltransferase involved in cell wall biosynthesis